MLPKLASREAVDLFLRDHHITDVTCNSADVRGMGIKGAVDLGIFSDDNMCKYKITCVPMMLRDGSDIFRDICGDQKRGASVAISAPSNVCTKVAQMKSDITKCVLNNWYRQEISGIKNNEDTDCISFAGALYFEICEPKLAAKCSMLGVKTGFCVHCYTMLSRKINDASSYDMSCRLTMIEIPGIIDFIKNNPDYVTVIK